MLLKKLHLVILLQILNIDPILPQQLNTFTTTSEKIHYIYSQYLKIIEKVITAIIPTEDDTTIYGTYDFIIVGSGSAGSVIANRLSEIPDWNILLLEAGKVEPFLAQVPIAAPALQFTEYNWNYLAEYQPQFGAAFNDHRMLWPRGRGLGGTTIINYMIYTRGNRIDYDRWAAAGNPGWAYDQVLPYFIKSERARLKQADYRFHGTNGELGVTDIYQSDVCKTFIHAGNELNLTNFDYNANTQSFGVSRIQATVRNGRRDSHASAFLQPIKKLRKNLHILTSAYVTKLLIDPQTRNAYGVEYHRYGRNYRVLSSKEVVLSAGTFNSAQLLMLAGVGPKQDLDELGIEVLEDLPVGRNIHDHLTFVGLAFTLKKDVSLSARNLINLTSLTDYFGKGVGPFTALGGVEGISYIKTNQSNDPAPIPDIELLLIDGSLATDYGLISRVTMNIRDDVYNALFRPLHNLPTFQMFPMLFHPKSIGYLKLQSTNPFDYPLFYGNYFSDPKDDDVKTFLASIRFMQKLARTKAFKALGARMNQNRLLGCNQKFNSDEYWKCAIRAISVTLHHQVGTVKMGPPDDPTAVVNHELKVYGISNLRVGDCSVIPFGISAHMNAPATMIGEKLADMLKKDWGGL